VFEAPERFSSVEVAAGVAGYALQIYLDFSAYSDIAIGSSQVLGFTLPENFRTPYRSANLQEFWRRWHISLSTWLRDYLYIGLGGSRGAPWRTYVNLILTMLLGGLWHGASWAFIVWGGLHGFGLAVTRYFQRATAGDERRSWSLLLGCGLIAAIGYAVQRFVLPAESIGAWWHLVVAWLYVMPLWAVLTAWLGKERDEAPEPPIVTQPFFMVWGSSDYWLPEVLRIAMCGSAIGFLAALRYASSETWIPLIVLTWGLGIAADVVERGTTHAGTEILDVLRRGVAVIHVFAYVCLAWVFFRATSFDNALAVLRRLATFETDHANLVPMVTVALVAGFACHFFANGSFRWLRDRFVALPAWGQGLVLASATIVLRELGHTKIVPFIYFQF
jgi:D-alanyl-lipoteichoic acid acyltransferase DltB (MBOAT superfamily)